MRLKLQTDYALRTLLFLAAARRICSVDDIAGAFGISREHLVKVVQELARRGFVKTTVGRAGGAQLAREPASITVAEVVEAFEGRQQVLECLAQPEVCVLEPGCDLRRLLIKAEQSFYAVLGTATIADLTRPRRKGGLANIRSAITSGDST